MAAALSVYTAGLRQVVLAEAEQDDGAMARALTLEYLPFAAVLRVPPHRRRSLAGSLPFVAAMEPVDGTTAAYVCRNFTCRQPVTTVEALQQELKVAP